METREKIEKEVGQILLDEKTLLAQAKAITDYIDSQASELVEKIEKALDQRILEAKESIRETSDVGTAHRLAEENLIHRVEAETYERVKIILQDILQSK